MSFVPKKRLARLISYFKPSAIRNFFYAPIGFLKRGMSPESPMPPESLYSGGGNFVKRGRKFRKLFIQLGNLQPNHRVLDVGSGAGRNAIPLTDYLQKDGEYWGFDIVKKRIEWCQESISAQFPNFHFLHANIYNKYFNPEGEVNSEDFRFPFEDNHFDFTFLVSVFTHMLPPSVENYMSEIARTLKVNGKCFITFFLLNDESRSQIRAGKTRQKFSDQYGECLVRSRDTPEIAIAYPEEHVYALFEKYNLEIISPIHYGSWCNRAVFLDNQDIVIGLKIE